MRASDILLRFAATLFIIFVVIGIIMLITTNGHPSHKAGVEYGVAAGICVGGPVILSLICAIWDN
jgi:hypothetical protein